MRILLDHCAPAALIDLLHEFEIVPARLLQWNQIEDGNLLMLAEREGFDLLLTVDQNISAQQNWQGRHLALLVLRSQKMEIVSRYHRAIVRAIRSTRPGTITQIDMPKF